MSYYLKSVFLQESSTLPHPISLGQIRARWIWKLVKILLRRGIRKLTKKSRTVGDAIKKQNIEAARIEARLNQMKEEWYLKHGDYHRFL